MLSERLGRTVDNYRDKPNDYVLLDKLDPDDLTYERLISLLTLGDLRTLRDIYDEARVWVEDVEDLGRVPRRGSAGGTLYKAVKDAEAKS